MLHIKSGGTAESVVARERALSDPSQELVFFLVAFGLLLLGKFQPFSDCRRHSLLLILKTSFSHKCSQGIDRSPRGLLINTNCKKSPIVNHRHLTTIRAFQRAFHFQTVIVTQAEFESGGVSIRISSGFTSSWR